MVYYCCIPSCRNDSRNDPDKKLSFHRFPVETSLKDEWVAKIVQNTGLDLVLKKHTRVCSKHFLKCDFIKTLNGLHKLKPDVIPAKFQPSGRVKYQRQEPIKKASVEQCMNNGSTAIVVKTEDNEALLDQQVNSYSVEPADDRLQDAQNNIQVLERYCVHLTNQLFCLERFSYDPRAMEFYTGFCDYATFKAAFLALQPTGSIFRWWQVQRYCIHELCSSGEAVPGESLPFLNQFFMLMCHLRQGFCEQDLAVRFNISLETVTRILLTWINYLYIPLSSLRIWPTRKSINENMPECLKMTFPSTRIILTTTKVMVQEFDPKTQLCVCSTYKGLVGISPFGAVTFVSDLYSGCISDIDLMKSSGILKLLYKHDTIMAPDTFLEEETTDFLLQEAKVVVPPFWKNRHKFKTVESPESRNNSQVKSFVESVLQHVQGYHIFDSVIPLSLAESANKLWVVCSLLSNFKHSLHSPQS
ncbi:uncharacterized protein LOC117298417 [Asterias rubens]|uniref:uncharacterized protein LOC117298417 n=1 Tax=Asterias rubens TaxID=7604 RepID=UPI001454F586|nr:uncharacterized protein LOC117298417 [Asterias rubens]